MATNGDKTGNQPKQQHGPANALETYEDRAEANLRLWRLNETTDPGHTRPVKIGRQFTAIDSYYQIKRATETFGPIGLGWGWELQEDVVQADTASGAPVSLAKCRVTLWYIDPETSEKCVCGPVIGVNQLVSPKGAVDDEAFKKATTDGVTKALSYLGFSADVFMGLYDDSKYVNRLKDEVSRKAEQQRDALPKVLRDAVADLPKIRDLKGLDTAWRALKEDMRKISDPQFDYMKARFAMRKRQLAPEEPPPPQDSGEPEFQGGTEDFSNGPGPRDPGSAP